MSPAQATETFRVPRERVVTQAKRLYEDQSDWLDIDDDARLSESDTGYWVSAWVWVDNADIRNGG